MDQQIEKSGLKARFIAQRIGVSEATLRLYRSGALPMPYEKVALLCDLLKAVGVQCDIDELAAEMRSEEYRLPGRPPKTPSVREPSHIAAGDVPPPPFMPVGQLAKVIVYQYIPAGPLTDEALIPEDEPMTVALADAKYEHLRVKGDSMTGRKLRDGNVLVLDTNRVPVDGSVVVFDLEGVGSGVATLRMKGRRVVKLEKASPQHRDIPIRRGHVLTIRGVVVETITREPVPKRS